MQCCPQGQPSQGPWNNGYPLPPTTRKCSYVYPAEHSSGPVVPGLSPWSKWQHNLLNQVGLPSPYETTSKETPEEPPIQSQRRKCFSIKHYQGVAMKPSAGIPNWCERQERITTEKTACPLTARLLVIWQMFSRS